MPLRRMVMYYGSDASSSKGSICPMIHQTA